MKLNYHFMLFVIVLCLAVLGGCASSYRSVVLTEQDQLFAEQREMKEAYLKELKHKPIYKFSEQDLDVYLGYLQATEPELSERLVHIGRKNIGQEYEMYLLGEFPYEIYDPQPLFELRKSDCVVFSEHSFAMALSHDWQSFFSMLQRIRYKNGEIGVTTRNHYTIPDWDQSNQWLVRDITDELAGDRAVVNYMTVDRSRFFKNRYKLNVDIPVQELVTTYIPADMLPEIAPKLKNGDFFNLIRGYDPEHAWAGHVGLVTVDDDGTVNILHSTPPAVREEPLLEAARRNWEYNEERRIHNEEVEKWNAENPDKKPKSKWAYFYGYKFLRLQDDPIANLLEIDGPDAPKVTGPKGIIRESR